MTPDGTVLDEDHYDCIVIGSGPGGYVAAVRAAQLGLRTAVVERAKLGGRCLHEACIPAKAMLRSAEVLDNVKHAAEYGIISPDPSVDFGAVASRRTNIIDGLATGVRALLAANGVEVVIGDARLRSGTQVDVNTRRLHSSSAVILATGSVPRPVPSLPFGGRILATHEAWTMDRLPASMIVVGAGASGAELASAYARLGTKVALLDVADQVLPTEDIDISRVVQRSLLAQGISLHLGAEIRAVDGRDRLTVELAGEDLVADWLVVATGRRPDLTALGLDELDVRTTTDGLVEVDARQETSVPGLYAIGDIVPGPALAHKASEEGIVAAEAAAGLVVHPVRVDQIPRATFCDPNVASFGLTERQASDQGIDHIAAKVPYSAVGATHTAGAATGLVKVVVACSDREILGGHVVGQRAPDLLQQLLDVHVLEGGSPELARIVHAHPTFSELVSEVARRVEGWATHS